MRSEDAGSVIVRARLPTGTVWQHPDWQQRVLDLCNRVWAGADSGGGACDLKGAPSRALRAQTHRTHAAHCPLALAVPASVSQLKIWQHCHCQDLFARALPVPGQ